MTAAGRALRVVLVVAATYVVADAAAHRCLREPRCVPDHRLGADGSEPATRPPGPGSPR